MRRQHASTNTATSIGMSRALTAFGDLRWLVFITLAVLVCSLVSGPAAGAGLFRSSDDRTVAAAGVGHDAFARGHILVSERPSGDAASFTKALSKGGSHSLGKIARTNVHIVDVAAGNEEAEVARLRGDPNVEFAEVDRLIPAASLTNDPMVGSEWHLTTINAPAAWAYSTGAGVTIAILDTGVEGTHPDLASQMVPGWNFYNNNSDTSDSNGHGTTVAGAAAAATNNSIGVASVAGGAKIMPIVIADPTAWAQWSTVAEGITYAADHGARVVNLSYVGASGSSTIQSAASYLRSKGGVLYVAAGNTGAVDNTAPNNYMMVVAATMPDDTHASWSTYGSFVDISAPGYNIVTTGPGAQYWYCWGTSLATPIVAATAALIIARRPDFTPAQIDATLKSSATDLGAPGPDVYFGAGRVNAGAALALAASTQSTDTTKPTVSIASPTGGTVGGTVTVSVNASDNVGVTRVELRVNGNLVATDTASPWQFAWNSTGVANGGASLTATAYDAAGNSATSSPVALTVYNATPAPPTVSILSPTGGTVSGTITVSVKATDVIGVTRVDLLVNNTLIATTNVGPYNFAWNTKTSPNGQVTLTAKAYDAAGYMVYQALYVTVSNASGGGTGAAPDTTPPVVTISSPVSGAKVTTSSVSVKASATDNSGTAGITMRLYLDGTLKLTVTGGSLSTSLSLKRVSTGTHTILVSATDAAGNKGSSQVQFTK